MKVLLGGIASAVAGLLVAACVGLVVGYGRAQAVDVELAAIRATLDEMKVEARLARVDVRALLITSHGHIPSDSTRVFLPGAAGPTDP